MTHWRHFKILMPSTILYGPGCLQNLGEQVKRLGKKALIVTDEIMVKTGYVDELKEILEEQSIDMTVFDKANFEPLTTLIDEGVKIFKEEKCDFLVALGGGSPIDAAKAVGVMSTNQGSINEYMGIDKIAVPGPPVVAIATTSGTGSEVTQFTIITDAESDVKMLIGSPYIMPTIAVNDPIMTMSVPSKTTAATGIDALCHATEAFISLKGQPFTEIVALSAVKRISKYLRRAWANGDDLEARCEMMMASMEAGMAFNNSSVTIIHGMSRPLGANFHIPHGLSNAVLMPACMEFAMMGAPEKFATLANAMGENITGMTTMESAKVAVEAMEKLCRDINIPSILGLGINKEKFLPLTHKMAEDAINSGSPAHTPRKTTKEDVVEIYKKAL